jgi:hypothetical protein
MSAAQLYPHIHGLFNVPSWKWSFEDVKRLISIMSKRLGFNELGTAEEIGAMHAFLEKWDRLIDTDVVVRRFMDPIYVLFSAAIDDFPAGWADALGAANHVGPYPALTAPVMNMRGVPIPGFYLVNGATPAETKWNAHHVGGHVQGHYAQLGIAINYSVITASNILQR